MNKLENLTFWIKAEEEFVKDLGENWKDRITCGWADHMESLLGIKIPDEYKVQCIEVVIGVERSFRLIVDGGRGYISADMIKYEYREQTNI